MIVQPTAFDERHQVRLDLGDVQPGDVSQLHQRVSSDVTTATADSGLLGVDSPLGLSDTLVFGATCQPTLQVSRIDPSNLTQQAAGDNESREATGPVPKVGVRDAKGNLGFLDGRDQLLCFIDIQRQRLLAENRNARLDAFDRRVEVNVVGRHHHDVVDSLANGLLRFRLDHFVVAGVPDDRIGPVFCLFHCHFRIGMQRRSGHATGSVKMDRTLMRLDDERTAAAADQTNIERSLTHELVCCLRLVWLFFSPQPTVRREYRFLNLEVNKQGVSGEVRAIEETIPVVFRCPGRRPRAVVCRRLAKQKCVDSKNWRLQVRTASQRRFRKSFGKASTDFFRSQS